MKTLSRAKQQPIRLTGIIELATGISVFASAIWVSFRFSRLPGKSMAHEILLFHLLMVAPGFVVALGCYLQTVHRKWWAILLVVLGSVCSLTFTLGIGRVVFIYVGDTWGLRAVWAGLGTLLVTFVTSCVHTFLLILNQSSQSIKAGQK